MITKFLYKYTEDGKKIITQVVENNKQAEGIRDKDYFLEFEDYYRIQSIDTLTPNFGKLYYAVFSDGEKFNYLDVYINEHTDDRKPRVKLALTDNVSHAAYMSKEALAVILDEVNYFNTELDLDFVYSGYTLYESLRLKDDYDGFFKKVNGDVYCQILDLKYPMFIGLERGQYYLTEDFNKACKVEKKYVRNLLVANSYIDLDMSKNDVAFSKYNIFSDKESYARAGHNSLKVSYQNHVLKIEKNFDLNTNYRLVQDETRSAILKQLVDIVDNKDDEETFAKYGKLYVKKNQDLEFELTDNASLSTKISLSDFNIITTAYKLFDQSALFEKYTNDNHYLYIQEDGYEFSQEIKDGQSISLSKEEYDSYFNAFKGLNKDQRVIITLDGKYVKYDKINKNKFNLLYLDAGFEASLFTSEEVEVLKKLLHKDFKKKELDYIPNTKEIYNITIAKPRSNEEQYKSFKQIVKSKNIRLQSFPALNYKTESDKAALEYLRVFYPKAMLDANYIMNKVLKHNPFVQNVLLVGQTANIDMEALGNASSLNGVEINVSTIETTKWGIYPPCQIPVSVNYEGSLRVPFTSLPKQYLEKFDFIYFGKSFKEDSQALTETLTALKSLNKRIIIANTSLCNLDQKFDNFYLGMKPLLECKRKFINHDENLIKKIIKKTNDEFDFGFENCDKKISYYSIVKLQAGEFQDLLNKD